MSSGQQTEMEGTPVSLPDGSAAELKQARATTPAAATVDPPLAGAYWYGAAQGCG